MTFKAVVVVLVAAIAWVTAACGDDDPEGADAGTDAATDAGTDVMTTAGGRDAATDAGDYGITVIGVSTKETEVYADVTVTTSAGQSALDVYATNVDGAGKVGHLHIHVSPFPKPGVYRCMKDAVFIRTLQLCCPFVYDSRNTMPEDCRISFSEIGGAAGDDVAGTFEGLLYDDNGGRLNLRDGRFRGRRAN